VIERTDQKGERHTFAIDDMVAAAGYYDLALINVTLAPGAVYVASIGGHTLAFGIAADAKASRAPVVSRLLRFP